MNKVVEVLLDVVKSQFDNIGLSEAKMRKINKADFKSKRKFMYTLINSEDTNVPVFKVDESGILKVSGFNRADRLINVKVEELLGETKARKNNTWGRTVLMVGISEDRVNIQYCDSIPDSLEFKASQWRIEYFDLCAPDSIDNIEKKLKSIFCKWCGHTSCSH